MKCGKKVVSIGILTALVIGSVVSATDNGTVNMEDYFTAQGANITVQEESVDMVLNQDTASVTFDRPLTSDGFSLSFAGVEGNTLEKADIILTDINDEKNSIKLSYIRMNDEYTAVALNDSKRSYVTNGSMYHQNDVDFYVTYNAKSNVITDSSTYTIPVTTTQNGMAFEGFSKQMVSVRIELHGIAGSVMCLKELNRQRLGTEYEVDSVEPMITIINGVTEAMKGSVISLPTAFASDVLSDKATVKMSVKDPEGNIVEAEDGTKLSEVTPDKVYQIKIDAYGEYRIEYQATDGRNTTRTVSSQIKVVDVSKPTINLSEILPTEVKLGEELVLPEVTCEDNVTEKENIVTWVTVQHPSGKIRACGSTLKLVEEGQYRFTFHAMDNEGNIRKTIQKIYVEGE